MTIEQLLFAMGGVSISVIGYFLKSALNEVKEVKDMAVETRTKFEVLEAEYRLQVIHLTTKIDDLTDSISELTKEIKELNRNKKI